jgi:hypothetical protein
MRLRAAGLSEAASTTTASTTTRRDRMGSAPGSDPDGLHLPSRAPAALRAQHLYAAVAAPTRARCHSQRPVREHRPMDNARIAALAVRQGGVVSAAQLKDCGLSGSGIAYRVSTHRLFAVRRGVYALAPIVDAQGRRWAAILAVDPARAVLSHWSAAELHGFSATPRGGFDVTLPGTGGRRVCGLRMHRARSLRDDDVVVVQGLPVTSPSRTILDLAARADDATVRRLIREAEFVGCLKTGALMSAVRGRGGHAGVARVRRVDPATREADLAQTPLEDDLAALLARLPLPPPVAQYPVTTSFGERYRVDFAWPQWRLAVEADGRSAHARSSAWESDRARDADLSADGWLTMRFTRLQVLGESSRVGDRVIRTALRRGWVPTAAPRRAA